MSHLSDPLLQAYIDGYCGDVRVAEIEAHIASCSECSDRLEQARAAADRASQLLGALEPGPVHAPSFEELQQRAAARPADAVDVAAALEQARAATAGAAESRARGVWWRGSQLAWAATVVIAFGVGWLARSGVNLPVDLQAPQLGAAEPEIPGYRAPAGAGDEAFEATPSTPAPSEPAANSAVDQERQQVAGADEVDDLTAAKATAAEAAPAQASPALASRDSAARPQSEAMTRVGTRRPAAAEEQEPPALMRQNLPAADQDRASELNEEAGAAGLFADAAVAPGFVVVAPENAELWLGAPPRQLPDMALLRVEVGPGVLLENGVAERNAVRFIYAARSGQEIALLQQYTGPPRQPLAQVGAVSGGRSEPADAPARAERARVADEVRADSRLGGDREAAAIGGLDLPALVREPDDRVTYTWIDAQGYLLSISGRLEADVIQGLAGMVR